MSDYSREVTVYPVWFSHHGLHDYELCVAEPFKCYVAAVSRAIIKEIISEYYKGTESVLIVDIVFIE